MIRDKAAAIPDGEWVFNLGGWTVDQFADDDSRSRARSSMRRPAPSGAPASVLLPRVSQQPRLAGIGVDAPTGRLRDAADGRDRRSAIGLAERLPAPTVEEIESSTRSMFADLNRRRAHRVRQRGLRSESARTIGAGRLAVSSTFGFSASRGRAPAAGAGRRT